MRHNIRVLLYKAEGGVWNAQCLEYDIGAQAETLDIAIERFRHNLTAEIVLDLREGRAPLQDVPPAPARFWE